MLKSITTGLVLTLITIAIHGTGSAWWVERLRKRSRRRSREIAPSFLRDLQALCSTAIVLLTFHIAEVIIWAIAYLVLVDDEEFAGFEEALYFSMVTFASLGYGDVVMEGPWRLLSAVQAMAGLLAFGWSSALLFAVVQSIWKAKD